MDPLSITASAIALVQAIGGIAKGIRFLHSLGQIPLEYSGLLNELSTLQAVAEQVQAVLREFESSPSTTSSDLQFQGIDPSMLVFLKDDLAQTTKDLEAICDRLKVPKKQGEKSGANGEEAVSKWRWQREKNNIARLQQKARYTRENLSLCFTAFATSQTHRQTKLTINIQEALCTSTQNISLLRTENDLAREENLALHKELQGSIAQLNQGLAETIVKPAAPLNKSTSTSMVSFQASLVSTCLTACRCSCHRLKRSQSPGWLGSLIGGLFLEYNTIPLLQPVKCDVITCKAKSPSSVRLYYMFPQWLLARSIEFAVSWSSLTGSGSSLHLRVPRVLEYHGVWKALLFGDMRWVLTHMARKDILPTDVDHQGISLALAALDKGYFQISQYFIQQGCDIHLKDKYGRTVPSQAKIRMAYTENMRDRHILESFASVSESNSPWLRRTIHGELDTPSSSDSADLNCLDDCGYAPLHWAIYSEDINAVQSLLTAGANPNLCTSDSQSPLLLAVETENIDFVELLLNNGADVNYRYQRDGDLAIVSAFESPKILRLLIDHGAHISGFRGGDGSRSPLDKAADDYHDWTFDEESRNIWAESLSCLISAGIDIDNQDNIYLQAPIMKALWNRNAILLDLLIEVGARLDLVDSDQEDILHYAACSSLECIEVLRHAQIDCIDPDRPSKDGITPMLVITKRMYMPNDELGAGDNPVTADEFWAFKQLIDEIRERYAATRRQDSTDIEPKERVLEIATESHDSPSSDSSVSISSVAGYWGGSQASTMGGGEGGIIRARSDCSECEEFFDT
ncbi:ankyrin [Annulohypoxylon nitens]|nr:ankyrin [Annulohypoxylon nitens]